MKRLSFFGAALLVAGLAHAGPPNKANDAKKRMTKGVELYNGKKYEDAIQAFSEALALVPDAAGPHRELAKCYQQLGQPERTIHHFTVYLERRPDAPERADIESFFPELQAALPSEGKASLTVEAQSGGLVFWSSSIEERRPRDHPAHQVPHSPWRRYRAAPLTRRTPADHRAARGSRKRDGARILQQRTHEEEGSSCRGDLANRR